MLRSHYSIIRSFYVSTLGLVLPLAVTTVSDYYSGVLNVASVIVTTKKASCFVGITFLTKIWNAIQKFCFMHWKISQPTLLHNITYRREAVWGSSTSFFLATVYMIITDFSQFDISRVFFTNLMPIVNATLVIGKQKECFIRITVFWNPSGQCDHGLYLHSRHPSYESYQMDCFATLARRALQIRLFWRNCKKWQNNPADISEVIQICPEAILHDCWGFKIHKFLVFIKTVILTSNRELHFYKSFFESVLQLTLQIVYVLKFLHSSFFTT